MKLLKAIPQALESFITNLLISGYKLTKISLIKHVYSSKLRINLFSETRYFKASPRHFTPSSVIDWFLKYYLYLKQIYLKKLKLIDCKEVMSFKLPLKCLNPSSAIFKHLFFLNGMYYIILRRKVQRDNFQWNEIF